MKTITWTPGTDKNLDTEFDNLRQQQYENKSHRLWKNYSKESFLDAVALTICWNDSGEVEMCSSIAQKTLWPKGVYRILNRLWKHSNKIYYPRTMSPSFAAVAQSQIEWLEKNANCELYFISRQTENWEAWVIKNFDDIYKIKFETDNYKYLTCPCETDNSCWQKIIYSGNKSILDQWKKRQS
jgi:hypothetical protein